jgi:peptidoglycan hydrolase-like protein with peptidoglycan-binding domain
MPLKKLFATTLLTLLFLTPLTTNALTIPEMEELIAKLTAQVQLLVQQLAQAQGNTSTSSHTPTGNTTPPTDYEPRSNMPDYSPDPSASPKVNHCFPAGIKFAIGQRHAEVISLQKFLKKTGDFTYGEFTTYYGTQTKQAVQRYQCREMSLCSGTPSTNGYGLAGPGTRKHMCGGVSQRDWGNDQNDDLPRLACQPPTGSIRGLLQEGQTRTYYASQSGTTDSPCISQARTCEKGTLSGSNDYRYDSCKDASQAANTCVLDGVTMNIGEMKKFYKPGVPHGMCDDLAYSGYRTCRANNFLSGDDALTKASCQETEQRQQSCTLDGRIVNHGDSADFFSRATVTAPAICASFKQTRTCTHGELSGSNTFNKARCITIDAALPSCSISSDKTSVTQGESFTLSWQTSNTILARLTNNLGLNLAVSNTGGSRTTSTVGVPAGPISYTLCVGICV